MKIILRINFVIVLPCLISLSYKILDVLWARDNDQNLIVLIEAKNWEILDTWEEYSEEVDKKIEKLLKKDEDDKVDWDKLRERRGTLISQEMLFK